MHNPSSSSYTDSLLELYATNRDRSSKGRSSDIVEVHDNGSPFQYSPNNNNNNNHSSCSPTSRRSSPKSKSIIGSTTSDILNYLNNSAGNNSNSSSSKSKQTKKKKKVLGQNYHFIPMMGKKSKTYNNTNTNDDSDDSDGSSSEESDYEIGYDVYMNGRANNATNNTNDSGLSYGISSNGGMMNIHNNNDGQIMSDRDMLRDVFTTTATSSAVDQQQSLNEKQTSNDTNNTNVRTTFGRRSDVGIAAEDSNDEKQLLQNKNTAAAYNNNKHVASSSTTEQPFTSPLGRRIWSQYCTSSKNASPKRHEHQDTRSTSTKAVVCFKHLPSHDFLRLPPSIIQIQHYYGGENKTTTSTKTTEWVNIDELERRVMQHHLDLETMELTSAAANESPLMKDEHEIIAKNTSSRSSTSSSLITSECFTKVIERHPKIGLGMSLRIHDGCVYIHSLLRNDGSRVSF